MLAAARLGQRHFRLKLTLGEQEIEVTREIDGGLETVALKATDGGDRRLQLNEPRYVKLPNIMKAKKKPLETLSPGDLGVVPVTQLTTLRWPSRQARNRHQVTRCGGTRRQTRNDVKAI